MKIFTTIFFGILTTITLGCTQNNPSKSKAEPEKHQYVRKNANTPGGQADLVAMQAALEKMRKMNCDDPRSWYYQGAIHSIPRSIVGENKLCSSYQNSGDYKPAWNNCTHDKVDASSFNFLLWHRLYIWHFEKIVRELSGKKDFALPYWNYSENSDAKLPELLRNNKGSLYTDERRARLNKGLSIESDTVQHIQEQIKEQSDTNIFISFSKGIEQGVHGYMHDYIGADGTDESFYNKIYQEEDKKGLMALVPSAGFDPVFWLHHSKIDYLWDIWQKDHPYERPSLEDIKKYSWSYLFFEPNKDSTTYTMEEAYHAAYNQDYVYEGLNEPIPLANVYQKKQAKLQEKVNQYIVSTIWENSINKAVGNKLLALEVASTFTTENKPLLTNQSTKAIILELDVLLDKKPVGHYKVYLKNKDSQVEYYAGTMTFFGADHDHGGHGSHKGEIELNFVFDVTDELKNSGDNFEIVVRKNSSGNENFIVKKAALKVYQQI